MTTCVALAGAKSRPVTLRALRATRGAGGTSALGVRAAVLVAALCATLGAACDAPPAERPGDTTTRADAGVAARDGGGLASAAPAGDVDGGAAVPAAPTRLWVPATPTRVCALATKISLSSAQPEVGAGQPLSLRLHFDACAAKGDVDAGPCTTTVKGNEVIVTGAAAVRSRDGVDAGPCEPVSVSCTGPVATTGTWTVRTGRAPTDPRVSVRVPAKAPAGGVCSQ